MVANCNTSCLIIFISLVNWSTFFLSLTFKSFTVSIHPVLLLLDSGFDSCHFDTSVPVVERLLSLLSCQVGTSGHFNGEKL